MSFIPPAALIMDMPHVFHLVPFVMGLFSSLHCIGMCGSIIGTLTLSLAPEVRQSKTRLLPFIFSYNLGRIVSYSVVGGLAGAVQWLIIAPFHPEYAYRLLQIFSAGITASAGLYIAGWFPRFAYIEKAGSRLWRLLEPWGRRLIPVKNGWQAFLFGCIWGWIPCGLVYSALALAAATGSIGQSALAMLTFGLGTLPAVMGVGIMTGVLTKLSRMGRFKRIVGLSLIALALLSAFPWLNPMRLQHL